MIDLFKTLEKIPSEKLHPKFLFLRDHEACDGERKVINSWTEGFVDRDNKIVEEFQTSFHSAFWELYLHHLLAELSFKIDTTKNRPDFVVTAPQKFIIEAVVSNIKLGGRGEETRNEEDVMGALKPLHSQPDFFINLDEAITRYSNAIDKKCKKLKDEYQKLNWVGNDTPFVIALASYSQVQYGREFFYPVLALLFGYYFDPQANDYCYKSSITKPGTKVTIDLDIFEKPEMKDVSAVIFSCTVTIGKLTSRSKSLDNSQLNINEVFLIRETSSSPKYVYHHVHPEEPELHSDGLFVLHNPNAKNPLPLSTFDSTAAVQISYTKKGLVFQGRALPIFCRLSLPKIEFLFRWEREEILNAIMDLNETRVKLVVRKEKGKNGSGSRKKQNSHQKMKNKKKATD